MSVKETKIISYTKLEQELSLEGLCKCNDCELIRRDTISRLNQKLNKNLPIANWWKESN